MIKQLSIKRRRIQGRKRPLPWAKIWYQTRLNVVMIVGAIMAAFGYAMFQVPYNIAAGGVSGISIIVNHFVGWPVGLLYWALNLPLLVLGFFYLGRWAFLLRTLVAVTVFSIATDFFVVYMPHWLSQYPITDDLLLTTIYGGIVGGIGGGLIYRSGGTMGGTGIIGRIIQQKTGQPLSQVYFYTDGLTIMAAGLVFGWDIALYGFLMLFLNGLASDYTLEGPSSARTATIITNRPQAVIDELMVHLHRGVSFWEVTGGFTGETRYLVLCTVTRPQVRQVKQIVAKADPDAFVTIGVSHEAMGAGFTPMPASVLK
ncbi:YitT family protein [Candidatus Leptofilum sp.]|uniref:YitT family protein n=1 Tax=Candidatus Leptofilum sp. TaxID=3241576 RepID=UPI003B5AAD50